MSFGSDARCEGLISPTLQTGSLRLVDVILKDIDPCICTVQEDSFLTDWNDFFYNGAKYVFSMKWANFNELNDS